MSRDADLPTQGDMIPQSGTTGDANLGDQNAVLSNHHVVADLNQVIDLCSFSNHGRSKRTSIDCDVGTNFNIVLNPYRSHLRNLEMNPLLRNEAKSIRSQH